MSRPKSAKSKSKSKVAHSESKTPVVPNPAAKSTSPESTPDQRASNEHRVETTHKLTVEEYVWSEWVWSEEGQMCYRGRKDSKGEWVYDFAPLPKAPKQSRCTLSREEPIEYLMEELKVIWEPRLVLDDSSVVVTAVVADKTSKVLGEAGHKETGVAKEDRVADSAEIKITSDDGDGKKAQDAVPENQPAEKQEKAKKRHVVRRGRQLERPERNTLNHTERNEKVKSWQTSL